jgi:hypothetical protein
MSTALKVFSKLTNVYLQAEIIPAHLQKFKNKYILKTESSPTSFFNRKKGKTAWGDAFRIFFDTTEVWAIESLEKLGFHVTKDGNGFSVCNKDIKTKNLVTNEDLFWKLIEYGYRLGNNASIPFELHEIRNHLRELRQESLNIFNINNHESENPIDEAILLNQMN